MHIISLHSQKGGTGKTSIALSLVFEALNRGKVPLFIDADLSGTSVRDILHFDAPIGAHQSIEDFFLEVGSSRNPIDYLTYVSVLDQLNSQQRRFPILLGRSHSSSKMMPLVYKENHTHYLRSRLEALINSARKHHQIDTIIIDNSPGSWGLSQATKGIIDEGKLKSNTDVTFKGQSVLVSSTDLNDIVSCINLLAQASNDKYTYVVNRSPYSADIAQNGNLIAQRLDAKGQAMSQPDYLSYAQELRAKNPIKWVSQEDAHLQNIYKQHVQGFRPISNIKQLFDLVVT
ncbi:hypothetical protein [Bdellovibrio sp. HCB-110]|uniref:hypothetical protein n=1 Tax=Bdellovibrio sp. HCB-110 TaxID=3391182 RepID=UPI0039B68294